MGNWRTERSWPKQNGADKLQGMNTITLTLNITGQLTIDAKGLEQFLQRIQIQTPKPTPKITAEPDQITGGFINEQQLLEKLQISRRTLFSWRRTGKIPYVRLGGRRILFHWPNIEAALLRHQRGGQW